MMATIDQTVLDHQRIKLDPKPESALKHAALFVSPTGKVNTMKGFSAIIAAEPGPFFKFTFKFPLTTSNLFLFHCGDWILYLY